MGQIGYSSGFGFQSTYGTWHSNFEVYLPWPDGGFFAQFWHDGVKWNGPVVIAGRPLTSVAATRVASSQRVVATEISNWPR